MSYQDKEKNRIEYFDVIKGIGIILVILGHMTRFTSFSNKAIYTFHMPLFFLVSGYFISFRDKYKDFVKKKATQLLLPYFFSCLCVLVIQIIKQVILGKTLEQVLQTFGKLIYSFVYGSGMEYYKPFYIPPIGVLWFLLALFISLITVRKFLEYKYGPVYIVLLAYAGYLSSMLLWLPFSVQAGFTVSIFVYIGYLANKNGFLEEKTNPLIVIFALGIWLFGIFFGKGLYVFFNGYGNGLFSIVVGICGTYIVLLISRFICKHLNFLTKILVFFGKNSLIVLCFHLIEYTMIPWSKVYGVLGDMGIPIVVTYIIVAVTKIGFCTLGILLVYKLKFLRKIFSVRGK